MLNDSLLLPEKQTEFLVCAFELASFEEAGSQVEPSLVQQGLVSRGDQFLEGVACLDVLLLLVKVAPSEELVWKVLNIGNGVLPKARIFHPLRLDKHHAQTQWVEKLLETLRLVQESQHLDVVVHYVVIFYAALLLLLLFPLVVFNHLLEGPSGLLILLLLLG